LQKYSTIAKRFYFPLVTSGSQIWLNPLVDDWQITYTTNLWGKKKKKTHFSGCGNDRHFMVDVINIGRSNFFQNLAY
jgi:hypothetical protein